MKQNGKRILMLAAIAALCMFSVPAPATQTQLKAEVALKTAMDRETVDGDLKAAIDQYKKIVATYAANHAVAAKALIRMGQCYEKLGDAEARKAYERVVREFADQAEIVAQARVRLAALGEPAGRGGSGAPVIRQIWATSKGVTWNRISPDGRSVAGVDDGTGDLVIRSLAAGETRRLSAIPKDRWKKDGAEYPVWSRDGRYVAYGWYSEKKPYEFRIADVADGTSRVVPMDARFRLYSPDDWSPDGRSVLAKVAEALPEIRRLHLAWVTTSGGTVQLLAGPGVDKYVDHDAFLAPDGAWIVSRILDEDTGFSIMASGGGPPRPLIPAASSDSLVGWSPDGTHVLFISRERGSDDLMALRVVDGQAVGQPFLIRTLQGFSSLGVSQAGALLYHSWQEPSSNLYRASFDATSGRVGPPSRVDLSTFHSNGLVSWSPDGRRLAYVGWANGKPSGTLSIWSAENPQTRSFSLPFKSGRWGWFRTTWSADGRWVYAAGLDDADRAGVYRINTESGTVEAVLPPASGVFPMGDISMNPYTSLAGWSPDARVVYKNVNHKENGVAGPVSIVEHRLADHVERELFKSGTSRTALGSFVVSPDGSQLAFTLIEMAPPPTVRKLMVMPAAGGPAKTVATLPAAGGRVNWTPDGRSLVFAVARSAVAPGEPWLCDVGTGAVTKLAMAPEVLEIAVSPSGKEIVYVGGPQGKDDGVWMIENFLPPKLGLKTALMLTRGR